jgi:hypothetical protein
MGDGRAVIKITHIKRFHGIIRSTAAQGRVDEHSLHDSPDFKNEPTSSEPDCISKMNRITRSRTVEINCLESKVQALITFRFKLWTSKREIRLEKGEFA